MTRAAQFGRGTFTYIGAPSQVQEKMNSLFSKLDHPVLHDLEVDWDANFVEAWPARIPDVYLGEPIVIAARLPATEGRVTLRGRRESENVRIDLGLGGGSQQSGVARLWARRKIAHLMDTLSEGADRNQVSTEVAALGIRHHLVTRWTSLVAVDITPTAPVDAKLKTSAVPGHLPKGADAARMLGRLPQGATPFPLLLCLGTGMLLIGCSLLGLAHRKRDPAEYAAAGLNCKQAAE
jgi:Ca-activated chloride channel family protein